MTAVATRATKNTGTATPSMSPNLLLFFLAPAELEPLDVSQVWPGEHKSGFPEVLYVQQLTMNPKDICNSIDKFTEQQPLTIGSSKVPIYYLHQLDPVV